MEVKYPVYEDDGWYYCPNVTRNFGAYCNVELLNGQIITVDVMPANAYILENLEVVGHVKF